MIMVITIISTLHTRSTMKPTTLNAWLHCHFNQLFYNTFYYFATFFIQFISDELKLITRVSLASAISYGKSYI